MRKSGIIYAILSLALWIYLILRARYTGMVNDEAATFLSFVHHGRFWPFHPETYWSANNHLLNSLLTWLSYQAFGISEWSLRLPNLLAFPVFAWFAWRLGQLLHTPYLRILLWVSLLAAHFLLEFFGYCRGYGLSLALMSGALYYLISHLQGPQHWRKAWAAWALLGLATLANLNLLVSYLILGLWMPVMTWRQKNKWPLLPLALCYLGLLLFLVFVALQLREAEELYHGHHSLSGTLYTMLSKFAGVQSTDSFYLAVPALIIVALGGLTLIYRQGWQKPLTVFYSFALLNLIAAVMMFHWLDVYYPSERTGLHWYLLLMLTAVFGLQQIPGSWRGRASLIAALFLVPIVLHSLRHLNLTHSLDQYWRKEQVSDRLFAKIHNLNQEYSFPLSTHCHTNYYTFTMGFKNLKESAQINVFQEWNHRAQPHIADLMLVDTTAYNAWKADYQPVYHDPPSQMTLLQRTPLLAKKLQADTTLEQIAWQQETFAPLLLQQSDTAIQSPLRLDYDLKISAAKNPLKAFITLEVKNSTGQNLHYDQLDIHFHQQHFDGQERLKISHLVHELDEPIFSVHSYLWVLHNQTYRLDHAAIKMYHLESNAPTRQ